MQFFISVLQSKHFHLDEHGFVLKRLLLTAIAQGRHDAVVHLLGDMEEHKLLQVALDQPVNSNLDTLLHVAMQEGAVRLVGAVSFRQRAVRRRYRCGRRACKYLKCEIDEFCPIGEEMDFDSIKSMMLALKTFKDRIVYFVGTEGFFCNVLCAAMTVDTPCRGCLAFSRRQEQILVVSRRHSFDGIAFAV